MRMLTSLAVAAAATACSSSSSKPAAPAPIAVAGAESSPADKLPPANDGTPQPEGPDDARSAGILGEEALVRGGAFASLTGSGEIIADPDSHDGVGGRGRESGAIPELTFGEPTASPGLDRAIISRYIKRASGKLQYCYEKELLHTVSLSGTVIASFTISPDGTVSSSRATGLAPVEPCVADVIRNIGFPKPRTGASVIVTYPFVYAVAP